MMARACMHQQQQRRERKTGLPPRGLPNQARRLTLRPLWFAFAYPLVSSAGPDRPITHPSILCYHQQSRGQRGHSETGAESDGSSGAAEPIRARPRPAKHLGDLFLGPLPRDLAPEPRARTSPGLARIRPRPPHGSATRARPFLVGA